MLLEGRSRNMNSRLMIVNQGERGRYINIYIYIYIQSTLVISKSKGPSETLRDIRSSTYQICRIEENTNGTTIFHK